jgi:hypothetical protein
MYGAAYAQYSGPTRGHYGEVWWPKTSRLAKCPEMQSAYDDFLAAREKKKACKGCFLGIGKGCSCRKKYEDRMESLERKGDAAWKTCKVETERGEIADEASFQEDWSAEPDSGGGSGGGYTTVQQYPPAQQQPMYDQSAGNLAAAGTTGMAAAGGTNWMLYGGIAVAGLAAVLMMRK